MGHPFCDVKLGADRLHEKVAEQRFVDIGAVVQCTRYAKEDFIRKFLAKEGRWPLVELSGEAPVAMTRACLMNTDPRSVPLQRRFGRIHIEDYDHVTILPNLKFDWVENFLPYVKDRTVALTRSETVRKYLDKDETLQIDWRQTRLLLFYLLWPETATDHRGYMEAYVRGDWRQVANYLVIRIVPKEKEHKIEARGFGCKTSKDGARGIIQELNVARFLNDYSDEHVMTLGEISLAKKLLGFRRLKHAYRGYRMIVVTVDASSWNNRFRSAAVAPVTAAVLDAVFDTPIFSKTHDAYQRSLVYMPDADEVYYWDGQSGGIEGLNQDTWVFTYIHQMKVCMENHPYPYYILCKGDDLRIAVMIPPEALMDHTIDDLKTALLSDVSEIGARFGHVIKVEDSYASECYFAYSKNTFVNDVEQPQSLRKIQKCYGANNAFLTTPDDYVACAMSNAHSASKTSPSPVACYAVALVWTFELLTKHELYMTLSDSQLCALVQIPNMLGGFPIIYLHNFFVRAESDLLPPFLDLARFLRESYPHIGEEIVKALRQKTVNPSKCLSGLMVDPCSLPLDKPRPAATLLRQEASSLIEKRTRNRYIKQLFRISRRGFERQFLRLLESTNVYNARLMGALYACTPEGIIRELVRKFESGRSIYNALFLNRGRQIADRITRRCYNLDQKLHMYRLQLLKLSIRGSRWILDLQNLPMCPYALAQEIRDTLWERPVEGITQPPLQHMLHIGEPERFGLSEHVANNHFELWIDPPPSSSPAPLFTIGTREPFVGATTGRGLAPPEAKLEAHNILASKVKNLMDIYKWSHMTEERGGEITTSNLHLVAEQMIEAYTGCMVSDIMPFAGKRVLTRVTQHHVRVNSFQASIVPNTLLNLYTRVSGNSRSHVTFESSAEHYRVNFLQAFCYSVSMVGLPMWLGADPLACTRLWSVTVPCDSLMRPIRETPVVLADTTLPDIDLPQESQLASLALDDIANELQEFNPAQFYVPDDDDDHISLEEAQLGAIQGLINRIWRDRRRLQTLYTSHHLTSAGLSSLRNWSGSSSEDVVCSTDIRNLPMATLIRDVSFMVFTEILHRLDMSNVEEISTALGNIPGEEFPWFILLELLDDSGRFYELQREVQRFLPAMRCIYQDNPRSYAATFGSVCYQIALITRPAIKIMQLSHSSDTNIINDIKYRLWGMRWACLDKGYARLLDTTDDPDHPAHYDTRGSFLVGIVTDDDELTFGPTGEDETRVRTQLFPPPDDPYEYLEGFHREPQEVAADARPGAPGAGREEECQFPDFLRIALRRYRFTARALMGWIEQIMNEDGEYERLRAVFDREVLATDVEIVRTDLVTCINRMRAHAVQQAVPRIEAAPGPPTVLPRIRPRGPRKVVLTPAQGRYGAPYDAARGPQTINLDLQWNETLFNERWTKRPLGMGNISMSRAAYILYTSGITELPAYSTVACLGDGYGGYSAVCASLVHDGVVLYNTFPNRVGSHPEPVSAQAAAEITNTRVDQTALIQGHYDLALHTTFLALEQSAHSVALVTLDAELKDCQAETGRKMLAYTCIFFVRRGANGSVLIMKVCLTELDNWLQQLGMLLSYCHTVMVARNAASAMDGEVFVVAQLDTPHPELIYEARPSYPSIRDIRRIRRFADRYVNDLVNDIGGTEELPLFSTFPPFIIGLIRVLPICGWSKLQEVCRVVFPQELLARAGRERAVWIDEVERFLEQCEDQCLHELRGRLPDRYSHLYDSFRHTLVVCDRYLRISGFLHITRLFRDTRTLTVPHYVAGYTRAILRTPEGVGLHDGIPDQLNGPIMVRNTTIDPSKSWRLGCRWGVSALGASDNV